MVRPFGDWCVAFNGLVQSRLDVFGHLAVTIAQSDVHWDVDFGESLVHVTIQAGGVGDVEKPFFPNEIVGWVLRVRQRYGNGVVVRERWYYLNVNGQEKLVNSGAIHCVMACGCRKMDGSNGFVQQYVGQGHSVCVSGVVTKGRVACICVASDDGVVKAFEKFLEKSKRFVEAMGEICRDDRKPF